MDAVVKRRPVIWSKCSRNSRERPSKMSSPGGRLREVIAYGRWSLTGDVGLREMVAYGRSGHRVSKFWVISIWYLYCFIHAVSISWPLTVAPSVRFTSAVMIWPMCYSDAFSNFRSGEIQQILCQVVAYRSDRGRLWEVPSIVIWLKVFEFWKSGRLWEVVANGGSTVYKWRLVDVSCCSFVWALFFFPSLLSKGNVEQVIKETLLSMTSESWMDLALFYVSFIDVSLELSL